MNFREGLNLTFVSQNLWYPTALESLHGTFLVLHNSNEKNTKPGTSGTLCMTPRNWIMKFTCDSDRSGHINDVFKTFMFFKECGF